MQKSDLDKVREIARDIARQEIAKALKDCKKINPKPIPEPEPEQLSKPEPEETIQLWK